MILPPAIAYSPNTLRTVFHRSEKPGKTSAGKSQTVKKLLPSAHNKEIFTGKSNGVREGHALVVKDLEHSNKKIVDYLVTGKYKKVLLRFHHGLGDSVMFWAAGGIRKLQNDFPDIQFFLHTQVGQEEIFGSVDDNPALYDIVFEIVFPCAEWDSRDWTKGEKCIVTELGYEQDNNSLWSLPGEYHNNLIGVHFISTCLDFLCVKEKIAKKLYDYIVKKDFVVLDTHFSHQGDRSKKIFDFEKQTSVTGYEPKVSKLIGLMKALGGFAGTASGNFFIALTVLPPQKILFLRTNFCVNKLTRLPVHELDVRNPDMIDWSVVDKWLYDVVHT